jgi:uncharacterized protein with von Willebrand factor type A (vWA) domain
MLHLLTGFVQELRCAGLPVSLTEELDAMRAVRLVPLEDRAVVEEALAATLVKSQLEAATFWAFFDLHVPRWGDAPGAGDSPEATARALLESGPAAIRELARGAVARYAGMGSGRPVGASYYVHRTLRHLDLDSLLEQMTELSRQWAGGPLTPLDERLAADEHRSKLDRLSEEVAAEVRRRLVDERGPQAVARSSHRASPLDVDFRHATAEELDALRRSLYPLTRKLAVRLARKRRHRRKGPLDFRSTLRHSLSYGGAPAEPRFRHVRPARPELMVVADISGSVAAFARFTLQLVHALSAQFSKVRSFVFIDAIDEVTGFFEGSSDLSEALRQVSTEADVVWMEGHSDYGHVLESFWGRWGEEVTARTTVLFLGDARNNYHAVQSWVVAELRERARHVYWLNPEPRSYWDTGDSVLSEYALHCDAVFECRNLRQLEAFVEHLG